MTAPDVVIQLILPIAAILAARNAAAEDLGVGLVLLGVAIEIGLTAEHAVASATGRACRSLMRDVGRDGIAVDSADGIWGFHGRILIGVQIRCRELMLVVAIAVGGSGVGTHHGE